MTTVYLSIGTMKTGTTALQSFMGENREVIKKQNYCYPFMEIGIGDKYVNRNAHFLIYQSDRKGKQEKLEHQEQVRRDGYKAVAEAAKEYPNVILSDELIWHRSNKRENFWQELKEDFASINCEVKVIVYLRRQDLLVQSLWNQYVKSEPRINKEFDECIYGDFFQYFPLNYYEQLQKISNVIGKENMIVRVYEKGRFEGEEKTLFSDFLKYTGVEYTDEFTFNNIVANMGINGNFVEIKRILNGVPEYKKMSDFMKSPLAKASRYKEGKSEHAITSMFSYDKQVAYQEQFNQSNKMVSKDFLGKDCDLFTQKVEELPQWEIKQEEMYQDILVYVCEMFVQQEKKILSLENKVQSLQKEVKKVDSAQKKLGKRFSSICNNFIFRFFNKFRKNK